MTIEPESGFVPVWTQGDRLRKARAATGLTTRDFAHKIGVSHGTVTNAEGDKRAVRQITLNAWALATGVSREWLESGTGSSAPSGPDGGGLPLGEVRTDALERLTAAKRGRATPRGRATDRYVVAAA